MSHSTASIDERITSLLREQPRNLHDIVVGLWPEAWGGPRESALCAVGYVRCRVDAMQRHGHLVLQEDLLHLAEQLVKVEVAHAA